VSSHSQYAHNASAVHPRIDLACEVSAQGRNRKNNFVISGEIVFADCRNSPDWRFWPLPNDKNGRIVPIV
jgi:hypothetical protein